MSHKSLATAQPPQFIPFGRYLLLERIAIGGMAEVYLAKSFSGSSVSDLLAIKRILPSLAADSDFIRMFLDEAKIAGQLRHPGVVQILELGRIGVSHYLAMDFVWGKDLLQIMRRCRLLGAQLTPSFVAWLGASMCEALHYAHRKSNRRGEPMSIIHRDISPQNVLLSFDGRVKIIDFGIAKAQSRSTHTQAGVLKGKVGYMSPEQVQGHHIDHRSDIFAVGTCLYELLTLRSLFARENNLEALENVRHVRAKPIREVRGDVPDELERILQKTLTADPEARYGSARELQQALLSFVNMESPGYGRVAAATWLRDAFRKELTTERARLDAFDQVGRPQVAPADEPRRNSATDLEIKSARPPSLLPTDEEDGDETLVVSFEHEGVAFVHPAPSEEGPAEVFFTQDEVAVGRPNDAASDAASREVSDSEPDALSDDPTRRVGPSGPPTIALDQDVSLDPSQINSGIIQQLMEGPTPELQDRARIGREPTAKQPVHRGRGDLDEADVRPASKPAPASSWIGKIALALLLLMVGAAAGTLATTVGGKARVEVRTVPAVSATVLLDGVPRGRAPLRLDNVAPGHHVLTIVADGHQDATREIDVSGHSTALVEIALTPRAAP